MTEPYPVAVLGSCVTRDAIAGVPCDDLLLVDYTARTSLASLACQPHFDAHVVKSISSLFQRRMVERDMLKTFWNDFGRNGTRALVIDLIDDRFDLAAFPDGGANTLSAEYNKVRAVANPTYTTRIASWSPKYVDLWNRGFERLNDLAARDNVRIVMNCVYYVETGNVDIDTAANIDAANDYLSRRYDFVGGEDRITYDLGELRADPSHRWGLANFHYCSESYFVFISRLRALLRKEPASKVWE